ncbi:ABC transporter permease [Ulvibacterium marinum]|uniref:ABC transporter permease n=1 Tax=Ulvibacterium marinum TaxID=2419782 RepID=UPI0024959BD8|nr:ABC transporter permease [Ulvibacterium marinum]
MDNKKPNKQNLDPPKWADRFLEWYCSPNLLNEIQGDLYEAFSIRVKKYGHRKARLMFIKEVLLFCKPSSLKKSSNIPNLPIMLSFFRYYLKTTFRNLVKNKAFASINIFGLVLGMTAFLLILNYAWFELSYDEFHEKGSQIYRIRNDHFSNGISTYNRAITYRDAGPSLKEEFPEVLDFTRMNGLFGRNLVVTYANDNGIANTFKEEDVYYVDDNFLSMFTFPLIKGDPAQALKDMSSVVLTESIAIKYFGTENPIGKIITVDGNESFTVTGVLKDIPSNSHMKFDMLFPIKSLSEYQNRNNKMWSGGGGDVAYTYVLLANDVNPASLERKFHDFLGKHQVPHITGTEITDQFVLQPLKRIHLHSNLEFEIKANGNSKMVTFLMIIGFLVLSIAWINYINLSAVRATKRAKEVGVRKVIGATKGQLAKQFITEALVLNFMASLLSVILILVLFPKFKDLTGLAMEPVFFSNQMFLLSLVLFIVFGAILSGLYPAFVMSSFEPLVALKGKVGQKFKGISLVKGMTVFQYAISIVLLAGTFTVFKQVDFMQNQDLGIEIDQTIVINAPKITKDNYASVLESFREETLKHPDYIEMTASSEIPGRPFNATSMMAPSGASREQHKKYASAWVDYDFLPIFGLDLISGRNFSEDFQTDESAIIVNEEFVKSFGFVKPKDAIGQLISSNRGAAKIIGVVNNYHQVSLKNAVEPAAFFLNSERNRKYISFRISSKNLSGTIDTLQKEYEAMFPGNPFEFFFLDDYFDQQYRADRSFGTVFLLFSVLALFITCLGLFNLSFITTLNRIGEIAVRKVLGASTPSIVMLFSKDFIKPIALGSFIGIPIIWIILREWLSNYAFRIDISFWLLFTPVILTLIIASITMSYHILKAARSNTVESLRIE